MPRYKVQLSSFDRTTDNKDIEFTSFVEADNSDDAIEKARAAQKAKHPDMKPADTWSWSSYETAEKN